MTLFSKIIIGFIFISLFIQCEEDSTNHQPDSIVLETFYKKYPTAQGAIWTPNGSFEKVNFSYDNFIAEAWFSTEAHWLCSQKWIAIENIPSPILRKLQTNMDKPIPKVKMLEQVFCPASYLIPIEETPGYLLYFTAGGKTEKEITETLPSPRLPASITNFIYQKYPASLIWKGEKQSNGELDILMFTPQQVGAIHFNKTYNWIYSSFPLPFQQLPSPVTERFRKSNYKNHTIQKIVFQETPTSCFYTFVLENNNHEETQFHILTDGRLSSDKASAE